MKKPNHISTLIFFFFLFVSCNTSKKGDTQNLSLSSTQSLENLDKNARSQIVGLWKLFKREYSDGSGSLEENNVYLKINSDSTFEGHRALGKWALGFLKGDSASSVVTLYSEISNRYEKKFDSYYLELFTNDGTKFLRLVNLNSNSRETYVHATDVK